MADFKLKCPDCNVRLRRVKTVDWHLEIKHIKWLYSCRRCGRGWIYYPLKKTLTPETPNKSSVELMGNPVIEYDHLLRESD
jgi:hypothetical protein